MRKISELSTTQIKDGVALHRIADDRFKKNYTSISLSMPLRREDITLSALLPYLIDRGNAAYPDMSDFRRRLMQLYGVSLSATAAKGGTRRALTLTLSGPAGRYLPEANACAQAQQLAFDCVFDPYLPGGRFDPDAVAIEKEKLRETILTNYNDKRHYLMMRAGERFFGADPRGLCADGYLEDIESISAESLTDFYFRLRDTARVDVMSAGAQAPEYAALAQLAGRDTPWQAADAVAKCPQQDVVETQQLNQDKLALMFTCGRLLSRSERAALRVGTALFGGTATSRLFTNVREKRSLCYYCAASPALREAYICVDSGVQHADVPALSEAVLAELAELQKGNITQQELDETKLALVSALRSLDDGIPSLHGWYLGQILYNGDVVTPQQELEAVQSVTANDIAAAMSLLGLNLSYQLSGEAK